MGQTDFKGRNRDDSFSKTFITIGCSGATAMDRISFNGGNVSSRW